MTQPLYPGSVAETPDIQQARSWCFSAHLTRLAQKQPDKLAMKCGEDTLTYGQLDTKVTKLANALREAGIERGDRVATVCMNHLEHIITFWAAWRLGAVIVPMNFRLAPSELTYLITDSGAKALVIDGMFDKLEEVARQQLSAHLVVGDSDSGARDFTEFLETGSGEHDYVHVEEQELCAIMYTSGTTGLPKGAMLSYTNLLAQTHNVMSIFKISGEDEINLCGVPLFHIAGIGGLLPNFRVGGHTVIQRLGAFDPQATMELIRDEGITQCFLVPTQWQAVCSLPPLDPPITSLRRISWGAAPTTKGILEAMERTFPGVENIAVFGQTEMSPVTCSLEAKDAIRKIGSVGRPIPGVEARIVDPAMQDVAKGEVGEIVYRGPNMMLGYWNREEATRDAFTGGWFHSGDLVREDDEGFIYVVDRLKDMLISGGENIYCAEVEAAVQSHPDVMEAAVIGRPDEKWGEVPVVVVAPNPGARLTEQQVLDHVADKLAKFKQPKAVHLVEALPRNASGKVTKPALRDQYTRP
ncbi:long-chain-fatty-acid--CoA ligase [Blastococcus sp. Marseille-P5729]|uniref:long-chain-fatty-acid--CoA ligase n=1 Tax=Blastococcus sp. Marseille-P5729 TaxID=2086582 RepID=UPI000D0F46B1|nr:long-chain-fatty-acid--CoA ligase [Blastococcus sp. Marseille-P5729]